MTNLEITNTTLDLSQWKLENITQLLFNSVSPTSNNQTQATGAVQKQHSESFDNIHLASSVIIIALGVVGFLGNVLSIYVYSRPCMRTPVNQLMIGLAVSDAAMCITGAVVFAPLGLFMYYKSRAIYTSICYLTVSVYPLALSAQTASVWTLILITVERFIAVTYPFRARTLLTTNRTRGVLVGTCAAAFIYNTVRFAEYKLVYKRGRVNQVLWLRNDPSYVKYYVHWAYLILLFLIPFLVLVILNGYMIWIIRRARIQRERVSNQQLKEYRTTTMMVAVVVAFLFLNSVPLVLHSIESLETMSSLYEWQFFHVLIDICNISVMLNSSVNVLIYLFCSTRFRFLTKMLIENCYSGKLRCCVRKSRRDNMSQERDPSFRIDSRCFSNTDTCTTPVGESYSNTHFPLVFSTTSGIEERPSSRVTKNHSGLQISARHRGQTSNHEMHGGLSHTYSQNSNTLYEESIV